MKNITISNENGVSNTTTITMENGELSAFAHSIYISSKRGELVKATVDLCAASLALRIEEEQVTVGNLEELNRDLRHLGVQVVEVRAAALDIPISPI